MPSTIVRWVPDVRSIWARLCAIASIAFSLSGAMSPANAQTATVSGTVRVARTGIGLPGAVVTLLDSQNRPLRVVRSDMQGDYSLPRDSGGRVVSVRRVGFTPTDIALTPPAQGAVTINMIS